MSYTLQEIYNYSQEKIDEICRNNEAFYNVFKRMCALYAVQYSGQLQEKSSKVLNKILKFEDFQRLNSSVVNRRIEENPGYIHVEYVKEVEDFPSVLNSASEKGEQMVSVLTMDICLAIPGEHLIHKYNSLDVLSKELANYKIFSLIPDTKDLFEDPNSVFISRVDETELNNIKKIASNQDQIFVFHSPKSKKDINQNDIVVQEYKKPQWRDNDDMFMVEKKNIVRLSSPSLKDYHSFKVWLIMVLEENTTKEKLKPYIVAMYNFFNKVLELNKTYGFFKETLYDCIVVSNTNPPSFKIVDIADANYGPLNTNVEDYINLTEQFIMSLYDILTINAKDNFLQKYFKVPNKQTTDIKFGQGPNDAPNFAANPFANSYSSFNHNTNPPESFDLNTNPPESFDHSDNPPKRFEMTYKSFLDIFDLVEPTYELKEYEHVSNNIEEDEKPDLMSIDFMYTSRLNYPNPNLQFKTQGGVIVVNDPSNTLQYKYGTDKILKEFTNIQLLNNELFFIDKTNVTLSIPNIDEKNAVFRLFGKDFEKHVFNKHAVYRLRVPVEKGLPLDEAIKQLTNKSDLIVFFNDLITFFMKITDLFIYYFDDISVKDVLYDKESLSIKLINYQNLKVIDEPSNVNMAIFNIIETYKKEILRVLVDNSTMLKEAYDNTQHEASVFMKCEKILQKLKEN